MSTRAAMLTLVAMLAPFAAVTSGATAATVSPQWIEQDGDGHGASLPVLEDFNVREVLFNANRFPAPNGNTQRPGLKKYLAYGTMEPLDSPQDLVLAQVGMSTSDDGYTWTAPQGLTIHDSETGLDVPLIVNDPTDHFAVAFGNVTQQVQGEGPGRLGFQFALYYRDHQASTSTIGSYHVAVSLDGVSFELDQTLTQDATVPVIGGGFKADSFGPTQIIFNPNGSSSCTTGTIAANFPYNCRVIMVYAATGTGGEHVALAGSGTGLQFRGLTAPVLSPGSAGAWDDSIVSLGHIQRQPDNSYAMYYAGGRAPNNGCFGGLSGCFSLGVATSPDGLSWTKAPQNPITPRALLEQFSPDDPSTLFYPVPVLDGSGINRVFFSRITSAIKRDFYAARQTMVPGQAPQIRVTNPAGPYQAPGEATLTAYVGDTLGTNIGVNLASLTMDFDGSVNLTGFAEISDSLVGALTYATKKIRIPDVFVATGLPDGDHVFNISIADLDGNVSSVAVPFTLDRTAPDTTLLTPAPSPQIQFPTDSIGIYEGETTDSLTPLFALRAIVTNVLGISKTYEIRKQDGQFTSPTNGFSITQELNNGKTWRWRWVAPVGDPHTILPGPYTVSIVGLDLNRNTERPDPQNTASVLII